MIDRLEERIIEVLEQNGIFVDLNDLDSVLTIDSITFVTVIIDLEKAFGISFDDNDLALLSLNEYKSVTGIKKIVLPNTCPDIQTASDLKAI